MPNQEYSLVVIGAGPSGQMAAKKAALLGRKVAVVDTMNSSLTPQRRMRRLMFRIYAFEDAGMLDPFELRRALNGEDPEALARIESESPTIQERILGWFYDEQHDAQAEAEATRKQLNMRNLTLIEGRAQFLNIDEIQVHLKDGKQVVMEPSNVIIATGSHYVRKENVPFDDVLVHDAKSIFNTDGLPASITIVGEHVVPVQFAICFALMGLDVTLVSRQKPLFENLDAEIEAQLLDRLTGIGVNVVSGVEVDEISKNVEASEVTLKLTNGNVLTSSGLLWLADRVGNTQTLDCEEAGVELDEAGNIVANAKFRTAVGHIYAVGDVVTSPLYESVRKDQGRLASAVTFGLKDTEQLSETFPVGIYVLPEIAFYGLTEEAARKRQLPVVVGRVAYEDIPYGRLCGQQDGMIKLVINRDTEEIVGVHIIGRAAQEVIHFGMTLVEDKVRISRIIGTIFNGTTLHELYHYAAMDAHMRMR